MLFFLLIELSWTQICESMTHLKVRVSVFGYPLSPPELHFVFSEFSWTPMSSKRAERIFWHRLGVLNLGFWTKMRYLSFREWIKMRESFQTREGDMEVGMLLGKDGVGKNDKTFHIKSWLSYLSFMGFENDIMMGWEAHSPTFPWKYLSTICFICH